MRATRLYLVAGMVALIALIAGGCGTTNNDTGSSTVTSGSGGTTSTATAVANPTATPGISESTDQKIASQVPSAIASKGTLTAASDATYAPMEFIASDGNTVIGADTDLAKALGQVMGVQIQMQNAGFDSILPGLSAGKFDLGISSFTITKEREQQVDFVSYLTAGESFFVKAAGGPNVQTLADLCGHTVAAERGTVEASGASQQDAKCKSAGNPGVNVTVYPDENGVNLALSSGRADVGFADSPPAAYAVARSNGQFKLSGKSFGDAPYGFAIPKGNGMAKPLADAVNKIMGDGTYKKILDYWRIDQGSITKSEVNPTNVPPN